MQAVILAAGFGTRLRPHTETTPKPLLPVRGRPILDWILAALPEPIDRILVVVHYLADQIEDYLREQNHFLDWTTVRQEVPRGTGDALRSCQPALESDRFLVLNGDDLYGVADLARLVEFPAALLVRTVSNPRQFGIAFTRDDGTLEKLVEKPDLDGPQLANIGAYVFPRTVFDIDVQPSPRGELEITDYVSGLAQRQPVHTVRAEHWYPIGTVDAWQQAEHIDLTPFFQSKD